MVRKKQSLFMDRLYGLTQTSVRNKGFTIIELIVVIVIIAILLGISTLVASKIIRRERVISETDRIVSLLKEAQKYSMINSFYKDADGIIQKRHYGVRIYKANNAYGNNNEYNFIISLVWKNLKSNDYSDEVVDKTYNISEIKIYKVPTNSNNEPQLVDNESVYFNDTALTSDNKTLRITDTVDEYKRDIVISPMGHINVESPE
jgi:prepilin-type N-terminal cleavage/methylation domain-containing protein